MGIARRCLAAVFGVVLVNGAVFAAPPIARVVVDKDENLSLDCRPVNPQDISAALRPRLSKAKPADVAGEVLADGEVRFQAIERVLQQYRAMGLRQASLGVGVASVFILCNASPLPGFSVLSTIVPTSAPATSPGTPSRPILRASLTSVRPARTGATPPTET